MNRQAVRELYSRVMGINGVDDAVLDDLVARRRAMLAEPGSWSADHLRFASEVVATADGTPVSNVVPFHGVAPEPVVDETSIVFGLDSRGMAVTLDAVRRSGDVYAAWAQIVKLTPLGQSCRQAMLECGHPDPWIRARARDVGIDVAAITASAKAAGIDVTKALEAEMELHELADRDARGAGGSVPLASPPGRVVDFDEHRVREYARAAGLDPDAAVAAEREMIEQTERDRASGAL